MTQKAASLTSSLFARKGKASPARLLISELQAAGAESAEPGVQAQEPIQAAAGARAAVNGRRRPKPVAELPLIAYVEAREAADAAAAEPPPAASLLERGTRSLRRPNGHGGNVPAGVTAEPPQGQPQVAQQVEVDAPAAASEPGQDVLEGGAPEAADGLETREQAHEPETISGDGNVAAIEDAPQDEEAAAEAPEPEPGEADAAAPTTALPPAALPPAPSPTAPSPTFTSLTFTSPIEASALPATLALRKAASLQTPPPPPAPEAALPSSRPSGFVWRSAAVIALGAVLGLGSYLALSGEPASPPVTTAPAPAATPAVVAVPAEPSPPAGAMAPAAPEPVLAAPEPSFDIIRIEPDGQSIIAGRAQPGSEWILLNNGSPIAAVRADANGEWVVLPGAALLPGANAFSLVPKDERGKVAIPAPAAAAPVPSAPAAAMPAEPEARQTSPAQPVAQPRAEAAVPQSALPLPALPRPKPPHQAAATPGGPASFQAAAAGPYEVQLASVRQSGDANRERLRLSDAFPALLGSMDLRVQEARLEGSGIFYRVRSGAIGDLAVARDLCRRLEAEGQGCLVVRRPEAPPQAVVESVPDAASAVRQQAERPQLTPPE